VNEILPIDFLKIKSVRKLLNQCNIFHKIILKIINRKSDLNSNEELQVKLDHLENKRKALKDQ